MAAQEEYLHQSSSMLSTHMSSEEEALQSICKKMLKSRFFRGYYEERRYVDAVNDYRDIIGLHRGERDLERLLLDIKSKLEIFYHQSPHVWIGITHGALMHNISTKFTLDTHIWVQLQEVAFGQYWFNIKSLRFRKNEAILRINMVRTVEPDAQIERTHIFTPASASDGKTTTHLKDALKNVLPSENMTNRAEIIQPDVPQIALEDFVNVVRDWGTTIKHSVYDFISNDINKDNIKGFLQFLGLVVVSLLTGSFVAIKYLGTFALRFMFEFTRFTHVMTPIIIKLIEAISKIVGGFYILLAMIWKDAFMKRNIIPGNQLPNLNNQPLRNLRAIEYNRPTYQSNIKYFRQNSQQNSLMGTSRGPFTEFERKFQ